MRLVSLRVTEGNLGRWGVYVCPSHIPRTVLYSLPFSFRKRSEAGHVTERRGRPAEYGRASREPRQSTGERWGSTLEHWASHIERCPDANQQKPVRAQGAPSGPRLQLPA